MQFDGSLGAAKLRPIIEAEAKINDRRIQAYQLVFETEFALAFRRQLLAPSQQLLEYTLVKLPGPVLVGIGQSRALRRRGHAQMFEFAFAGGQSLSDLVEAMGPPQLTEQHGDELAPAGKAARMALGLVFLDRQLELASRKQL